MNANNRTTIETILYNKILAEVNSLNLTGGMAALAQQIAGNHAKTAGEIERANCLRMTEEIKAGRMTQAEGKAEMDNHVIAIVASAMTEITSAINS